MGDNDIPERIKRLLITYDDLVSELKEFSGLNLDFYPSLPKDIPVVRIGNSNKVIMFVARIHGDEPTGTEACRWFIRSKEPNDFAYVLFPLVNTYGCEYNKRENIHNIDITRDFMVSKEFETLALKNAIEKFKPRFILDLHNTNFLTPLSKNPRGYLQPANDNESIRAALQIKSYLDKHGLSNLIRKDMLPECFLNPKGGKHTNYKKIDDGVFVRYKGETGFKEYTMKLGIPHICVESPAKTKNFFFREKEEIERYEKNFKSYVNFHYLSMLGVIEYLKARR
ncbi:MAG: hypothetical protein ACE5K4_04610 [Candidatus Hydrothermarchaeota archaeon]